MHILHAEVLYIRHMWSCANAIQTFGKWYEQIYRVLALDPPGTDWSIKKMKNVKPHRVDLVLCSTMMRAQQTALELFPHQTILVIPFIKEVGFGNGNKIAKHIRDQQRIHGADAARLDYALVTDPKTGNWTREAHETHYHQFLELLGRIVTFLGHRHIRIAVVTHSNFMKRSIFHTPDKPLNVGIGIKRYEINPDEARIVESDDSPVVKTFAHKSKGVPFIGIPVPKRINKADLESCEYKLH